MNIWTMSQTCCFQELQTNFRQRYHKNFSKQQNGGNYISKLLDFNFFFLKMTSYKVQFLVGNIHVFFVPHPSPACQRQLVRMSKQLPERSHWWLLNARIRLAAALQRIWPLLLQDIWTSWRNPPVYPDEPLRYNKMSFTTD